MTTADLVPSRRSRTAQGPCLTARPAAGAVIAMLFGLTVLVFLVGLVALAV